MHICACGGQIRRIHRNLTQKLEYMAIYRCAGCGEVQSKPWAYMFYFGSHTRCPICGNRRLRRLAEPDRIDRMRANMFQFLRVLMPMRIYHCRICRIQFYDWRPCPPALGENSNSKPPRDKAPAAG